MNWEYKHLLNNNFHPDSRVWVYQASRIFSLNEALEIEELLKEFTRQWKSHGTPVKGYAGLLFGQFIILIADETASGVSGCSTDSSVRIIKQVEEQFAVNIFDRQMLAFYIKEKVQLIPLTQLSYALENNYLNTDTLYFNNLVSTKKELLEKWIIPIKESWLTSRIKTKEKV